jgi:hypothetical protein
LGQEIPPYGHGEKHNNNDNNSVHFSPPKMFKRIRVRT